MIPIRVKSVSESKYFAIAFLVKTHHRPNRDSKTKNENIRCAVADTGKGPGVRITLLRLKLVEN